MSPDISIVELQAARQRVESEKSRYLYKPLALFPTGQRIMENAAIAEEQRLKDAGFEDDMNNVGQALAKLAVAVSVKDGLVSIGQRAEWQAVFEKLAHIRASASTSFQAAHEETMKKATTELLKLETSVRKAVKELADAALTQATQAMVKHIKANHTSELGKIKHAFHDLVNKKMSGLPSPEAYFNKIVDKQVIEGAVAELDRYREALVTMQAASCGSSLGALRSQRCERWVVCLRAVSDSRADGRAGPQPGLN